MSDEDTKTEEAAEEAAAPAAEETATEETAAPAAEPAKEEAPAEEEGTTEVVLSKDAEKILEGVKKLSVLELADLVKAMEDVFGVSAAAPVAMMAGGGGGGGGGDEAAKDSFDVELTSAGGSKINVIKCVREITGLGLKEAKDIVDGAPKNIKEGVKKDEAEELKTKLEEAGASVEIK